MTEVESLIKCVFQYVKQSNFHHIFCHVSIGLTLMNLRQEKKWLQKPQNLFFSSSAHQQAKSLLLFVEEF